MQNQELVITKKTAGEVNHPAVTEMIEAAHEYAKHSKTTNTRRGYSSDWNIFCSFCETHGLTPLPAAPEVVALFLTSEAKKGRKSSTLQRRISSISQAHQVAGLESPTKTMAVDSVWAGIRKKHGTAQQGVMPALIDDIRAMVDTLPDSLLGIRDRALLLVGFASAVRRSELVSFDVPDVEETRDGLVLTLRKSKTDQEGEGRKIGIPYGSYADTCPVRAYREWIEASRIVSGPIFRSVDRHGNLKSKRLSDKTVALVVKRCAEAANLDPKKYAGHSLRSGLATAAAIAGKSERAIMEQTGHKSVNMVRRYIRDGNLFRENAAASIGL